MAIRATGIVETRARRRAIGMRSTEAVLHEAEIAVLDDIKSRLSLASRSEAIRVLIAKAEPDALTLADAAALERAS